MSKAYYCLSCKRILDKQEICTYCGGKEFKELTYCVPVNVIGTKLKGKVLKVQEGEVKVLFTNESGEKYMKEYGFDKLKKIL